jgi:transcriptional regulator with XRE-family HTH domain
MVHSRTDTGGTMPRRVVGSIGSERSLARRITYERELNGWKQATLARKMTDVGVPMNQSAISKIENDEPPRRITVDELVGFSLVFGIRADELLLPPELIADKAARKLLEQWQAARSESHELKIQLMNHIEAHPHTEALVEELLTEDDRQTLIWDARRVIEQLQHSGALKGKTIADMHAAYLEVQRRRGERRKKA